MPQETEKTALFRLQGILESLRGGLVEDHSKVAAGLAEIVVELGANPNLSRYHSLAQELVRAVVREIETPIRLEIAKRLSRETAISREIVKILANDQIEVAWPILESCANLHDEDLVEISINQSPRHRLAIAQRKAFNELVSAALVCFSERDIVEAVLRNPGAKISRATFEQICALAKRHPELQDPLVRRPDLPLLVAFGMLEWVVEALQVFLYDRIGGEPDALKRIVGEAIDAPSLADVLDNGVRRLIENFVGKIGRISGEDIVEMMGGLPAQRLDLKILLASDHTFEPLRSMRDTVLAGNGGRFATICRAADMSKPVFEGMFQHLFMSRAGGDGCSLTDSGDLLSATRVFLAKSPHQARAELAAVASSGG